MKIVYVHGLDSSSQSMKGQLLQEYCHSHYPKIEVLRPDLNTIPSGIFTTLSDIVKQSDKENDPVVLVGSSLGGYFSTLVSNHTGCPALLLNPSIQPHLSLERFIQEQDATNITDDTVIYQTTGGWDITPHDLRWFNEHVLESVVYPERMYVLIKSGDELLDTTLATQFYRTQGVTVNVQDGGDHRMTDFSEQLPLVMCQLERFMN